MESWAASTLCTRNQRGDSDSDSGITQGEMDCDAPDLALLGDAGCCKDKALLD